MTTYSAVKAQIAKLEKQAEVFLKQELEVAIKKAKAIVEQYGLTAEHLGLSGKSAKAVKGSKGAGKAAKAAKPAGIPLYADPVSGKTWTGKGKQPNFIVDAVKKGKKKEDFLIAKAAPAAVPVAKPQAVAKAVKAVKAVKHAAAPVAPKAVAEAPKADVKAVKAAKPAKKVVAKPAAKKADAAAPVAAA